MNQDVPFKTILEALQENETPFPAKYLHRLSDISPEDLYSLMSIWPQIPDLRKHMVLEGLEDLIETDTLVNFDDLAQSLLDDTDPVVRKSAIHLLWENEDKKLVPKLLRILNEDQEPGVCATAASALGNYIYRGELEVIPMTLLKKIENNLLDIVVSPRESSIRRFALESLGYSSREEVIPLIEAAYHDESPLWVASSLCAMGRSCDERWQKQVLSKLHASNEEVRSQAIHAAGELELKSARPVILDMLEDEEEIGIRHELILALSKIGGEGIREKMEEILDSETDDEEAEFIEEAMDNLAFTNDAGQFSLFGLDLDDSFHEEELEEDNGQDGE